MTPDPVHRRNDTDEDKDEYRWRGFRRQIPSPPAEPPTSGYSATGGSSVGEHADDGSEPGDTSDPIYDAVVEEVERVVVAEHDFESMREEYDREKSWLINTTHFSRIFEYTAKHPGGKIENMLCHKIEEEEKEDDIKISRLAEDEKLGIERVNLFMERASTEHNIQACG